jgi:orotidine-5'-phosphate decarboxylase
MARAVAARIRPNAERARDHLIVALDVSDFDHARAVVRELGDEVSFYKIGWHLFAKGLADFIDELVRTEGKHVFFDFKTVDIGETMRGMISSVSRLGVEFITVMGMAATVAAHEARQGQGYPRILTVTLLTDHGEEEMQREYNTKQSVEAFVASRAAIAEATGADGVVASAREVSAIRRAVPRPDFLIVTPGIRPIGTIADDQKRTATPRTAISAGANYLVVGRPIIRADDKLGAALGILDEMQTALDERS